MAWIITNRSDDHLHWNDSSKSWEEDNYDTFSEDQKSLMILPDQELWEMIPWNKEE